MIKNLKEKEYVFDIITKYVEEKMGEKVEFVVYDSDDLDTLEENEILITYSYKWYSVELFVFYKNNDSDCEELFIVPESEMEDIISVRIDIEDDFIRFEFYDFDKNKFEKAAKEVINYIHYI